MIHRTRSRPGFTTFTLIEILVVCTLILVLVAMLFPAMNSVREAARRSSCVNNLMQIGIALENYETLHGSLPPGVVNDTRPIKNVAAGYQFGWITQILPLIDRKAVHRQLNFSVGVYDAANITSRETLISSLLCPSDTGPDRETDLVASSNYAGVHHDSEAPIDITNNGTLFLNSAIRYDDIADGTSQTMVVGEKRLLGGEFGWAAGNRSTLRNTGTIGAYGGTTGLAAADASLPEDADPVGTFSSNHPGGANTLFGDGSVRFVKHSIDRNIFKLLANRADGELLSADKF